MFKSHLFFIACLPLCAHASLWQRPDQINAKVTQRSNHSYRQKNYVASAKQLQTINTPVAHYNRGNALALSGKYESAIKAYDSALKQDPNLEDAKINRDIVKKLLDKQKKKQKDKKDKKNQNKKKNKKQPKQNNSKSQTGKKKQPSQPTPKEKKKNNAAKKGTGKDGKLKHFYQQVPDDPGGLLKNKFLRDYQRYEEEGRLR
ncbi:MAG: hypothetical protein DHS20C10_02900 [marine bacterium B5-7]|nr:MAG: hypothetical protein DHS20C10_02900 [marine bacterium B5-7]